jgi:S-adenosylmethionine-dependent methyltransferase
VSDPYAELAERFVAHYDTLKGAVRLALVARQLSCHLPLPPAEVADVGGGAGHQAIRLAKLGYTVTLLDPSAAMLGRAANALAAEAAQVATRVKLVHGPGECAPELLGSASFDAVLCHGVVMYLDDPSALIAALAALAKPGAIVSLLAKNASSMALGPALQGRYREAIAAFDADRDDSGMGILTRGDTVEELTEVLARNYIDLLAWYGIRVFTNHLSGPPPTTGWDELVEAEWEAGRRNPYRALARLIHLVGRRS